MSTNSCRYFGVGIPSKLQWFCSRIKKILKCECQRSSDIIGTDPVFKIVHYGTVN